MKTKTIVAIIFIFLIINIFMNMFLVRKSEATEKRFIYVDNAFYEGERDGSAEHPFKTITYAINKANDGDTIYVFGGSYTENLTINKKIKLWGSVERGETIVSSDIEGYRYFVEITADQVEFQNFTITNAKKISMSPIGALLYIKGFDVVVQNNYIRNSSAYGIFVDPISNGNFISGNTINNTKNGIVVSSSYNNDIVGNTLSNCTDSAINMYSCNSNRIYENQFYENKIGIKVKDSSSTNISNNDITTSSLYGIYIENNRLDNITYNNIHNNIGYGIYLDLYDGEVYENYFSNNSRGINLAGSNCKIYENFFSNSIGTGIYATPQSRSHLIYLNEFINNSKSAQDYGDNMWYNYLIEKGNYWSDYEGIDLLPDGNGDGIGDTYYTKFGVLDKYPTGFFSSPPNKPADPKPADLEDNVGLQITLEVTVSDPDKDELTAYFYRGDTNTLIKPDAIVEKIKSGEKATFTFIQGFDTTFTWYVIVNDSKLENKSQTWIFTTRSAPPDNIPPVVNPGGPYIGVAKYPVSFDGSKSYDPDGNIVFYRWNFGDGTSEILSSSPSHAYQNPGTYNIILTVVDSNRACSTNITTVEIFETTFNAKPTANSGGPYNGVVSELIVLNGSKSFDEDGYIEDYTWSYSDGTTSYGQITTHTFTSPGSYSVSLTVTDNYGGKNSTFTYINIKSSNDSPGFELSISIFVIIIILFLKRKRK